MIDFVQVENFGGMADSTLEYARKLNEILNTPPEKILPMIQELWPGTACHLAPLPNCPLCFGRGLVAFPSRSVILMSKSDTTAAGSFLDHSPCGCTLYGDRALEMQARLYAAASLVVAEDNRAQLITSANSEMVH